MQGTDGGYVTLTNYSLAVSCACSWNGRGVIQKKLCDRKRWRQNPTDIREGTRKE